jgi:tetratricopeptide (TPR) repeat protein
MYAHALRIWENAAQMGGPEAIAAQAALGEIYRAEGKYEEAEPLLEGALKATEKKLGPDQLDVATSLNNLALLYYCESRYSAAEPLYKRALEIRKKNLGIDNPAVLQTMQFYAALLRQEGRRTEAELLEALAVSRGAAHL